MIGDNIYDWEVVLNGPDDTLYAGYSYILHVVIPDDYPISAPNVKFITPIKHVNVNENGNICLDILKNEWSSTLSINSIIISIAVLLGEPNHEDPFNSDLEKLYKKNVKEYEETIKDYCSKHGIKI